MIVTADTTELTLHSAAVGNELGLRKVGAAFVIDLHDVIFEFHGKFIRVVNS